MYCPGGSDMRGDWAGIAVEYKDNGWTVKNGGRVSSTMTWNLLGGYMEFSMDTSNSVDCINCNFYVVAPNSNLILLGSRKDVFRRE